MTIKLVDAAFETTTTTGSGPYTLAGAQPGHQSFAIAGNGAKVVYQVNDGNASGVITQREIGIGTITISGGVTTLTRNVILYSTNSNAAINWGAGAKNVIGSIPANVLPTRDENLNFIESFGTIAGTANALTLTLPIVPLAYSDGMLVSGYIATTNTTAGATLAVNGLSVIALKFNGADPGIGNLPAGTLLQARYKASTGVFEIFSPLLLQAASTSTAGVAQLATDTELKAGTNTTKAVTPSNIYNTLGFSEIFESAEKAVTAGGNVSDNHGLGIVPRYFVPILRCKAAEYGYAIGDEVPCVWQYLSGGVAMSIWSNATSVGVALTNTPTIVGKTDGTIHTITLTAWKWVFRAWG